MKNLYFAAFIPAINGGYDVVIPDVENAFTCAENLEEAFVMAEDVLQVMLRDLVENKKPVPAPSNLEEVRMKTGRHLADIEYSPLGDIFYQLIPAPNLDNVPVKVTISLPKSVLAEVDEKAKSAGFTRSGFLAHAAISYHDTL